MSKRIFITLAFALVAAMPVAGQMWVTKTDPLPAGASGSPGVRTEWAIETASITLAYRRPSLKGRPLDAVAKPNAPWLASDDEPATLTSTKPLLFGSTTIPAGTYSLWVLPAGDVWTLILNKQSGAAAKAYQQAQDAARVPMKVDKLASPVDMHTMQVEPSSDRVSGGVQLAIEFGGVRAVAPFLIRR